CTQIDMACMTTSNTAFFVDTILCRCQLAPPSADRAKAMTLAAKSFQATKTVPSGPTKGEAPIERPGPLGSSARAEVNVAPWSVEVATWTPPPIAEPPMAESQAIYTLSRNGLPMLASAVIIGLSLKWSEPPLKAKKVTLG